MVGRPLSAAMKRLKIRKLEEDIRQRAIAAYREELTKPVGKRKGSRKVAKDFVALYKLETGRDMRIDHVLLIRGAAGGRTRAQANAARSHLTEEEENVVCDYIIECGKRGFPLNHKRLREHANEILLARLGEKCPIAGVGERWSNRFIDRHSDRVKMSWATALEAKRGRAVNENTIKAWFDLVEHTETEYEILPENDYATDEIGTNPFAGERERVMGGKHGGPQYQQRNGTRENITSIVTICADGTSLPPAVLFKGQAFQASWKQDNPANAS